VPLSSSVRRRGRAHGLTRRGGRPRRRSAWVHALALLVLVQGCRELLGLEPLDAPAGGFAASGAPAFAGAGGVQGGESGESGAASASAGSGSGADGRGGAASGASGAGGGSAGRGSAGTSGQGGSERAGAGGGSGAGGGGNAGGEPVFPSERDPCSEPGKLACFGPASRYRLLCDGHTWVRAETCGDEYLCARNTGACSLSVCDPDEPRVCMNNSRQVCDPDLIDTWFEPCPLGCLDGACLKPTSTERLTDRTASPYPDRRTWPNPIVPVCFVELDPSTLELRDAIRLAVDSTWGRFSGLGFSGFEECTGATPAIEVAFVEECRDELARVPGIGYRGSGESFRIDLCLSHFDLQGKRQPDVGDPVDIPLVAFMAKHTFGHALGVEHEWYVRNESPRLMAEALDTRTYAGAPFEPVLVTRMQLAYGTKPEGSLLGANGRCLADNEGQLVFASCDGASTARFRPGPSGFVNVETGACLQANGSVVTLEACEGDVTREAFQLARVRWLASEGLGGGRCVTPRQPPSNLSSPLDVRACSPAWDAADLFGFEFLGGDQVRIHTGNGSCVAGPATWSTASVPELVTCGGPHDLFRYFSGQLSIDERCLTVDNGTIEFRACADGRDQHFSLSGPLELGADALSLSGSASPTLQLLPLPSAPDESQVLDWYF
jgi:hypothetical protein